MSEGQEIIVRGGEKASLQNFIETQCPAIEYDPAKPLMGQLRKWVEGQPGNEQASRKQIKNQVDQLMYKKFRPYIDACVMHISREYNLELPKFSKKVGEDGVPNSGSIPFKRKAVRFVSKAELLAKVENPDEAFETALEKAGYRLEKVTQVREVEARLE